MTSPPEPDAEDLAALIGRRIQQMGISQRTLSNRTGIAYSTLNAWVTRRRGQGGGIDPTQLRLLAKTLGVTAAEMFAAAGRRAPAALDQEREAKMLRLYRGLDIEGQRALIQMAETLGRTMRAS